MSRARAGARVRVAVSGQTVSQSMNLLCCVSPAQQILQGNVVWNLLHSHGAQRGGLQRLNGPRVAYPGCTGCIPAQRRPDRCRAADHAPAGASGEN